MLAKGKSAVGSRTMGSKLIKKLIQIIYRQGGGGGTIEADPEERKQWPVADKEVRELAEMAVKIEQHYGRPMNIEWRRDGDGGKLYIVQARPETVASRTRCTRAAPPWRWRPSRRCAARWAWKMWRP